MKKYLIKVALALFVGAFMVSCAEKESDFVPLAEQKAKAFEEVFKEIYGEINPYQDWGFSSGKVEIDPNDSSLIVNVVDLDANVAYTRAAAFGKYNTLMAFNRGTRADGDPVASYESGANTQHNLWGDPNYHNLNVPPALTDGQKLRVKLYFQTHPNLTYEDPHYTNFFVQQVYKGHTNLSGSNSPEEYAAGNNTTVIGSNHMDLLSVGFPASGGESANYYHHVNDFNNGDYNGGNTTLVLNTGASTNDFSKQSHPDQITYMINSRTDCVGFWSSDGTTGHNDRCALVGAQVIDDWANSAGTQAWAEANNLSLGDAVVDDWNRSFVGLDYDQKSAEQVYVKDWNKNDGSYLVATVGYAPQKAYVWTGTALVKWDDIKNQVLKDRNNNTVYFVTDNTNQILATNADYPAQSDLLKKMTKAECAQYGVTIQNADEEVVDLTKIQAKINAGCLPVVNGLYQKWVSNIGGRDYYFSDWIVTLTNAGGAPLPEYDYPVELIDEWWMVEKGRVFCEDLGQTSREDLDYNDVVFDAYIFKNHYKYTRWKRKKVNDAYVGEEIDEGPIEYTKYYANVEILAAGGTIPVTIQSNIEGSPSYQVHDMFNPKAEIVTMINTRDNNSSTQGSFEVRDPVQLGTIEKHFEAVLPDGSTEHYDVNLFEVNMPLDEKAIKEIKITSSFGTAMQIQELKSVRGGVPRKFMAPIDTKWTSERKNISLAYPDFGTWVTEADATEPWGNVNTNYTYNEPYSASGLKLPVAMRSTSTINTMGEQDLWQGTEKYLDSWSLGNLTLTLDLDKFYAGDRLRFYAEGIDDDAWITVVIGNITPYFVDSPFPNYILDTAGNKTPSTSGCVEVFLDEEAAARLNNEVSGGKVTFQVQGRNFTLKRICRVLFQ